MSTTPYQPTLPAEVRPTDAELTFLDESPPGLFPENQNSNFGFIIRKIYSDLAQDVINWQNTIYNEHFASTSTQFLDQWEIDLGLPPNPVGISIAQRRTGVLNRLQRGPFTRTRRNGVIESYISTTFGNVIQLVPEGVSIPGTGIPIYGETVPPSTLYRVYENQPNFSYEVWIVNSTNPDMVALQRELYRINPAGLTFTLDNAHAQILDYNRAVKNLAPIGYWPLGSVNDQSVNANNGSAVSGLVVGGVAAPGLLNAAIGGADGATDFTGTNYFNIPTHAAYAAPRELTMTAWIQIDTLAAAASYRAIFASQSTVTYISLYSNIGQLLFSALIDGVQRAVFSGPNVVAAGATKYMITATFDGNTMLLYCNTTVVASAVWPGSVLLSSSGLWVGSAGFGNPFDGRIDEVAVFSKALTQAEIQRLYNTGINVK